ncbi:hypothetical protein KIW84_021541 [Lathyrus oleraceus]|uniref:Uncharacterized protein n=1 Tax=Pisum sativum TaxID=3888 RepID=A0A9D4Y8W0_PEA|nr:hypothetical protein KIW84_021541 [Pisum sativum]
MRIKYLEAALKQDMQVFDTEVRTSDVVFAINIDAVMVQDAISYSRCSSYDSRNQRHSYHNFGKLSSKGQEALSQAGDIVEQTVVGESRALQGYSSSLKVAQKLAFKDQVNSALEPLWHELKLLHKQAEKYPDLECRTNLRLHFQRERHWKPNKIHCRK